jgi:hypothetical protein
MAKTKEDEIDLKIYGSEHNRKRRKGMFSRSYRTKSKKDSILIDIEEGKPVRRILEDRKVSYATYKKVLRQYEDIHTPKPSIVKEYKRRRGNLSELRLNKEISEDQYHERIEDLKQEFGRDRNGKFNITKVRMLHEQSLKKSIRSSKKIPRIEAKERKNKGVQKANNRKYRQRKSIKNLNSKVKGLKLLDKQLAGKMNKLNSKMKIKNRIEVKEKLKQ